MAGKENPIHGMGKRAFYEHKWLVEAVVAVPPIFGAAYPVCQAWFVSAPAAAPRIEQGTINAEIPIILALVCAWLILGSVLKVLAAKAQDVRENLSKGHEGLLATLNVVHSVVAGLGGLETPDETRQLRVTFHRVVPPLDNSEYIEQIVPYLGGSGREPGGQFSIRSGITGRAIRENAVFVMSRQNDDYEKYLKELITDWAYTEADAKKLQSDRFSGMAVPIKGREGVVLGVVYLDSCIKNFFDTNEIQEAVVAACVGVTKYIGERYH